MGWRTLELWGNAFFYVGVSGSVVGIISIGRTGNRWSDMTRSPYVHSDNAFKKARAVERPFEAIVIPVIFASIALAVTGYFFIGVQ